MVNRDVVLAKVAHLRRSVDRLRTKQGIDRQAFLKDRDVQDIVLLNLQVAIQSCVDLAAHLVADQEWGLPGSLAGLFDTLCEHGVLQAQTTKIMRAMAGFRNLIVHEYAELDMNKVWDVLTTRLGDFDQFLVEIITYTQL